MQELDDDNFVYPVTALFAACKLSMDTTFTTPLLHNGAIAESTFVDAQDRRHRNHG